MSKVKKTVLHSENLIETIQASARNADMDSALFPVNAQQSSASLSQHSSKQQLKTDTRKATHMNIFNAQLDTPHFSFSAYGRTEAQARKALIHGLREHAIYYSIRRDWWMEFADDIIVTELELNACYRDGALWRRGDGSK